MDKQEAEKVIKILTEKQECKDKKTAFIKGVLYGTGFMLRTPEPNWQIIERLIKEGNDPARWLEIEKETYETHKKITQEHIELWESILTEQAQ